LSQVSTAVDAGQMVPLTTGVSTRQPSAAMHAS
jgi:hypothetical protein